MSLENIMTDVNELEKGMEQAKKENDRHRDMRSAEGQAALSVLRDFLSNSEDKLRKVRLLVELCLDLRLLLTQDLFFYSTICLALNMDPLPIRDM